MRPFPEINLNNYDDDDVAALNEWAMDAWVAHENATACMQDICDAMKDEFSLARDEMRATPWWRVWKMGDAIARARAMLDAWDVVAKLVEEYENKSGEVA